jgi:hypothetical protein
LRREVRAQSAFTVAVRGILGRGRGAHRRFALAHGRVPFAWLPAAGRRGSRGNVSRSTTHSPCHARPSCRESTAESGRRPHARCRRRRGAGQGPRTGVMHCPSSGRNATGSLTHVKDGHGRRPTPPIVVSTSAKMEGAADARRFAFSSGCRLEHRGSDARCPSTGGSRLGRGRPGDPERGRPGAPLGARHRYRDDG